MTTYDLTVSTPDYCELKSGDILNCPYSGTFQSVTLPKGQYKLEVWGAQGGSYSTTSTGGKGGYSTGILTLKDKTNLYLYSGGTGSYSTTSGSYVAGGFNGGGAAGYRYGGSGGGGSDIRINSTSLYSRVIVAGGGGGGWGYSSYNGGVGGGTSGTQGTGYSSSYLAGAGSASAGGSGNGYSSSYYGSSGTFGSGGAGASNSSSYNRSSGGGGGWYGGGGSGYRSSSSYYYRGGGGAGGGSGYVYTSSTASNYPSGCLLNSSCYLTSASTIAGNTSFTDYSGSTVTGHSGNGACRITCLSIENPMDNIFVKSSNGWKNNNSIYSKIKLTVDSHQLEYIESSGTQYIDTGFKPNENTRIVCDFQILKIHSSSQAIFGTRNADNKEGFTLMFCGHEDKKLRSDYCSEYTYFPDLVNPTSRYRVDSDKNIISLNNNDFVIEHTSNLSYSSNYNIYLFALNSVGTKGSNSGKMRLYSCQIFDNDVLVRNFLPWKKDDGTICMWDSVNNIYYLNAGSGTFTAGPSMNAYKSINNIYIKNTNIYTQLDYIESSGTQYINTNYHWQHENIKINTTLAVLANSGESKSLFGNEEPNSSGGRYFGMIPHGSGSTYAFYVGDNAPLINSIDIPLNELMTLVCYTDGKNAFLAHEGHTYSGTYSGTVKSWINTTSIHPSRGKIYIFANHNSSTKGYNGIQIIDAMRLYEFKMYDNNKLVRDFIPVKRNSDGIIGLFDQVESVFYTNAGTGNFIAGNELGPFNGWIKK